MLNAVSLFEFSSKLPTALTGEVAALILLVFFGVFSLLETVFPRRDIPRAQLRSSYKANIGLFVFNSVVVSLLSASSLFIVAEHYSQQGLLRHIPSPVGRFLLSFVLLDLMMYLWHKACHSFDRLWLFHRVHHNDPCLNTSTAFRIHIMELLFTNLLKAVYIVVLGVDQVIVLINESIMTLFVMFHHSNIAFKGEAWLGKIIIVPSLHRAHHSVQRREHDSNYGAVLSLWDKLFGTLSQIEPVLIGLTGYSPQQPLALVRFGFTYKKPKVKQTAPVKTDIDAMIAEAAYYKAEKRNFRPGHELLDWLEAKKEILGQIHSDQATSGKPRRRGDKRLTPKTL